MGEWGGAVCNRVFLIRLEYPECTNLEPPPSEEPQDWAFHIHFLRMTLQLPLAAEALREGEWGSPQSCSHPLRQAVTLLPHSKGKLSAGFGYYQVWRLGAGGWGICATSSILFACMKELEPTLGLLISASSVTLSSLCSHWWR